MERPKIGELLVAAGVIDTAALETALEKQRAQGGRLGKILLGMGALDEEMLVRTVARQLDMPVAWLRGKQVKAEVLSQLPGHVALKHRCLPVMLDRKGPETLLVAMEDPSDAEAQSELASASGHRLRAVLVGPTELEEALQRHYHWTSLTGELSEWDAQRPPASAPAPAAPEEDAMAAPAEPPSPPAFDPDPPADPEPEPEPGFDL